MGWDGVSGDKYPTYKKENVLCCQKVQIIPEIPLRQGEQEELRRKGLVKLNQLLLLLL